MGNREILCDLELGKNLTTKGQFIKGKIAKLDLTEINNVSFEKPYVERMKTQATYWKNTFQTTYPTRN